MSEKSGFEELMSQVDGFVFHPLTLGFVGFGIFCVVIVFGPKILNATMREVDRLKQELGMYFFPRYLLLFFVFLWGVLSLTLVFGLLTLLIEIVWNTLPSDTDEGKADFRFLLTKTTALTAVLGALVALPFTVIRLKLTTEQNRHNADVLYNEKLNNANADLHAMRQVTVPVLDKNGKETTKRETIWTDDIIRRNGAIDRLGTLAFERPAMATRIARMLCVYLREMTRDYPAEKMPKGMEPDEIWEWANALELKRSDMETAARVLGHLHLFTKVPAKHLAIDLKGVNLQAMQLDNSNFEHAKMDKAALDGTDLVRAKLNEAKLNGAKLNGTKLHSAELHSAELDGAELNGAKLLWAKLNSARLNEAELNGAELHSAELHRAVLLRAKLNGAKLYWAKLNGAALIATKLNGAKLMWVELNGANLMGVELNEETDLNPMSALGTALRSVNLKDVPNLDNLVKSAFGDASVILPDDIKPLVKGKWPKYVLDNKEYDEEWARFKEDPDAYIPPQDHEK